MRKVLIAVVALILLAAPSWAGSFGGMATYWDTDEADSDEGAGIKLVFDLGRSVDFEIRGSWLNDLGLVAQGRGFKIEATPVDLGVAWRFLEDGKVHPFLGVGGSFVFLNAKASDLGTVRMDDEAGYYVVGGLEIPVSENLGIFGEVLFRQVKADITDNGLPDGIRDFPVDLTGAGAGLGLQLSW
jgi:hypothetical protein